MVKTRRMHGGLLLKVAHFLLRALEQGETQLTVNQIAAALDERSNSVAKLLKRRFGAVFEVLDVPGRRQQVYRFTPDAEGALESLLDTLLPGLPLERGFARVVRLLNRLAFHDPGELPPDQRAVLLQEALDEVELSIPAQDGEGGAATWDYSPGLPLDRQGLLVLLRLEDVFQDLLQGPTWRFEDHLRVTVAGLLCHRQRLAGASWTPSVGFFDQRLLLTLHRIQEAVQAGSEHVGADELARLLARLPGDVLEFLAEQGRQDVGWPRSWTRLLGLGVLDRPAPDASPVAQQEPPAEPPADPNDDPFWLSPMTPAPADGPLPAFAQGAPILATPAPEPEPRAVATTPTPIAGELETPAWFRSTARVASARGPDQMSSAIHASLYSLPGGRKGSS